MCREIVFILHGLVGCSIPTESRSMYIFSSVANGACNLLRGKDDTERRTIGQCRAQSLNTVAVPPVVYDCVRVVLWLALSTVLQTADLPVVVKCAPVLVHLRTVV